MSALQIGSPWLATEAVVGDELVRETPFGEVSVTRKLYRAVGVPAVAPLDAALGLREMRELSDQELALGSLTGAEAVLRLRALRASVTSATTGSFTSRKSYADGAVPNPLPPSRPHLRIVK
ncbi:MAG TPA: hypothetical protein VK932_30670 [Kofleriaceae bacterium]|nr:hypothetical protein [Kofleriaceae bacterium]